MPIANRTWTRKALEVFPTNVISVFPIHVGSAGAITGPNGSTLLASRLAIQAQASVGDPAITTVPQEEWWTRFQLVVAVKASKVSTTDFGDPFNTNEDIVLTGQLYPDAVFQSPTAPSEYYVTFAPKEGTLVSRGQRKWDGTGPGFWTNVSLGLLDYDSALDGTSAGISFSVHAYHESLWGY